MRHDRGSAILRRNPWYQLHHLIRRCRARLQILPAGFTLLELAVVTVIIGTIAAMAAPSLQRVREQAEVASAISNLKIIEAELGVYIVLNFAPPATLAAIDRAALVDPWGNPYVYNPFSSPGSQGQARKDKFLVPLNTDYDLYSVGEDGQSSPPLPAAKSRDDVIRALDGSYVGLASEF